MKNLIVFILLLLVVAIEKCLAQDQHKIDSLLQKYKTESDTEKSNILRDISKLYWHVDGKKAAYYAQQNLELATKLKNEKYLFLAYIFLGKIYQLQDFRTSVDYSLTALKHIPTNVSHHDLGDCFVNLGNAYGSLGISDSALYYKKKSLVEVELTHNTQDIAAANNNLGAYYIRKSDFKTALEYFLRSCLETSN